jgi:hypothetical protein
MTAAAIWGPRRFAAADQRVVAMTVGAAAAGIWASVPDTEGARALLGSTIVVFLAAWISGRPVLTGPAIGAFAGLAVWATATGGGARPVSVFGAWGSMALMAFVGVRALDRTHLGAWFAAELVMLGASTQLAAVADSGTAALAICVVALAVSVVILLAGNRPQMPEPPQPLQTSGP